MTISYQLMVNVLHTVGLQMTISCQLMVNVLHTVGLHIIMSCQLMVVCSPTGYKVPYTWNFRSSALLGGPSCSATLCLGVTRGDER